jgi:hypothetical protein
MGWLRTGMVGKSGMVLRFAPGYWGLFIKELSRVLVGEFGL